MFQIFAYVNRRFTASSVFISSNANCNFMLLPPKFALSFCSVPLMPLYYYHLWQLATFILYFYIF